LLRWREAVDSLGDETSGRGFPGTAGAGKKVRVVDVPGPQGITQGLDNVFLADDVVKRLWSPFAV